MVVTVINQKGGVGKSTIAAILAYGVAERGQRVLLIDLDPQGNLSYSMTGKVTAASNVLSVLTGETSVQDARTQATDLIDIIPSAPMLAAASLDGHALLMLALKPVRKKYDYIIIDTPPGIGVLTINALVATDSVIIPAIPDMYSNVGIAQLRQTINSVNKLRKRPMQIGGIVITRYRPREVVKREMTQMLSESAETMDSRVYATKIPEAAVIGEAQATRQSVYERAPKHPAIVACRAFVNEALPQQH